MKYIKEFATAADYTAYVATDFPRPNVSYVSAESSVHYNPILPPPPFLCKLTLSTGEVVEIEGSGELTSAMTSGYSATCVSAEIGELCTSIGGRAFYKCSAMTTCTIGSGVTSIGGQAFAYCSGMTTCTIGSGVTSIGDNAFANCFSLSSITIPDSVTIIGSEAFISCSAMTTCTLGSGVTSIGNWTFNYCRSLTSITIPDTVTSMGERAFAYCSAMTTCTIGSGVTSIGTQAFNSCSSLSAITSLATTAPTIANNTFLYIKTGGTLYVPQGSSGYDVWMGTSQYYLGYRSWTKVEQ